MPHCSGTVKRKGSTQSVPGVAKQESVFSATMERIAMDVTPDWGLGAEGTTIKKNACGNLDNHKEKRLNIKTMGYILVQ